MKTRTEIVIDVDDWDKLVMETYKRPYSFQQQNGCQERGNFYLTIPGEAEDFEASVIPEEVNGEEMGVSFAAWLARDPMQKIKGQEYDFDRTLWWERNFYPDIQMIANDLHAMGLLDSGKYTINIDW